MNTGSSRSLRWFGTRVPLLSRGVLTLVTLFVALPLSAVVYNLMGFALFTSGWYVPLLLILPVGVASYFVFIMNLQVRYKNPPTDPEFTALIGTVLQKILVPSRAQVWVRDSPDPYIVSAYNPVFDAVIVSEPMVRLMLERPQAGEVLLAFHLARMPRTQWFGDFGGSLILLVIFTYLSAMILGPMVMSLMYMISVVGILGLISLMSFFMYFVIPLLPALIIKGAFWRHEDAFVRIQEVYDMHPQVAKVEVERGTPLNEEETQAVIWGVREWERKRRNSRRWGISAIITIVTAIIFLLLMSAWMVTVPWYYSYWIIYLPFLLAMVCGGIIYLYLKRWDKNMMGEVFQETTDSHEPIWMD